MSQTVCSASVVMMPYSVNNPSDLVLTWERNNPSVEAVWTAILRCHLFGQAVIGLNNQTIQAESRIRWRERSLGLLSSAQTGFPAGRRPWGGYNRHWIFTAVFHGGQSDALQACPAFAPLAASLALRRRNCPVYYFNIQQNQFHSPITSAAAQHRPRHSATS